MVYLQITMHISAQNRPAAAAVYQRYKAPFLKTIAGAVSKELLIRDEDVQVMHGFETQQQAEDYLVSELFTADVVRELSPLFTSAPEIRIYQQA
ncbi:hypothetical protein TUM12370_02480 [Salmonella enterica subsp. enterica serovar Choleraesuis]|nr:hypothetical protein TUM12370_02480 [Salmonella enterica subsp. enterica serovar Choleraesuis]